MIDHDAGDEDRSPSPTFEWRCYVCGAVAALNGLARVSWPSWPATTIEFDGAAAELVPGDRVPLEHAHACRGTDCEHSLRAFARAQDDPPDYKADLRRYRNLMNQARERAGEEAR